MSTPRPDSGDHLSRESVAVLPYSTVERQLDRANQRWLGTVAAGVLVFGIGLVLGFITAGATFLAFTVSNLLLPWRVAELAAHSSPMILAAGAWSIASSARDCWDATHAQLARLARAAAITAVIAQFWLAAAADTVGGSSAAHLTCGLAEAAMVAFSGVLMANLAARLPHRIIERHLRIATAMMTIATLALSTAIWLPAVSALTPRLDLREPLTIILAVAACAAPVYLGAFVFRLRDSIAAVEPLDEPAAGGALH